THQNAPSATSATRAPSTSTLSASGSRNAPELVLPWRRATHPSRASLPATAIQTRRVDQAAPRSTMRTMTTVASNRRAAVSALAGVASAEGPKDPARRGRPTDGGVGPVLAREGEEASPVELRLLDEPQQGVVVVLGLARIADDERGPEGGVGLAAPDGGDALEEATAVAPPPHAPQQSLGHVLQ